MGVICFINSRSFFFYPLFLKALKLVVTKLLGPGDVEDFFKIMHSGPFKRILLVENICLPVVLLQGRLGGHCHLVRGQTSHAYPFNRKSKRLGVLNLLWFRSHWPEVGHRPPLVAREVGKSKNRTIMVHYLVLAHTL